MLIHEFVVANPIDLTADITYEFLKGKEYIQIPDDCILHYINTSNTSFLGQWDYIGNEHLGFNYHGITIILNKDLGELITSLCILDKDGGVELLIRLCKVAKANGQAVIHFGV